MVWGGDLKIIMLPVLLLIASIVCGYLFEGSASILLSKGWVYVLLAFVLNIILTLLTGEFFFQLSVRFGLLKIYTAGRIWWLSWKGKKLLDRSSRHRYHVALAAM
jgi:uncharacterized membrane protein YGL010W